MVPRGGFELGLLGPEADHLTIGPRNRHGESGINYLYICEVLFVCSEPCTRIGAGRVWKWYKRNHELYMKLLGAEMIVVYIFDRRSSSVSEK